VDIFLDIYYSYLTATRIEDMENMGNIDIFTPIYGTDETNTPHIYWMEGSVSNS
jgi:hypothetical protein